MARAYSPTQPLDYGPDLPAGDWQALRGELISLLDQVESQVTRQAHDQGMHGLAERMRDLRYQVTEADPELRHREALRSVKRAVDRFSERDEVYQSAFAPRRESYAPNPRDTLESAIQQIRARQGQMQPPPQPRADAAQLANLAQAVTGISGRLERLETELRVAARSQTGNVKEIAEQVGQLSHVVELLAGAVGETGQVKRLEGQIAALAKLVSEGPKTDVSALNRRLDEVAGSVGRLLENHEKSGVAQRLDDVSATMGRLADLQVQFANKADSSGLKDGMRAIEEGVRNVYDRIDAIEKDTALGPEKIERLTEEMARFTQALGSTAGPEGLLASLERLTRQTAELQGASADVGGLRADLDALRATVVEAVEPRFTAIEMQIEALSDRVSDQHPDISVGQLEAQVRQLVARMDQTGEQLTGLAKLYSAPATSGPAPDFEALAEIVATRTSEAVALAAPPSGGGYDEAGIDEIERRVSRLLDATAREDLTGIEVSIREVSDRIARLEKSLTQTLPNTESEPTAYDAAGITSFDQADPPAAETGISAADQGREPPAPGRDAMPTNPAMDAPLRDKPFGDEVATVKAALAANNGPRANKTGPSYEPVAEATGDVPAQARVSGSEGAPSRPHFDPAMVERPPRPISSLDEAEAPAFPAATPAAPEPRIEAAPEPTPSANTFIAAARRAAQRQQTAKGSSPAGGSLIAKAFANFQPGKTDEKKAPAKAGKKKKDVRRKQRVLAGDKTPASTWKPDDDGAPRVEPETRPVGPEPIALDQEATAPASDAPKKESFLLRHRRPILIAASLVAIALMTLNLINQRLAESEQLAPSTPGAPGDVSSLDSDAASPFAAQPAATMNGAVTAPRVIPIVDSLATASIDPAAAKGFTSGAEAPQMPAAFTAVPMALEPETAALDELETASTGALPFAAMPSLGPAADAGPEIASPVLLEMPPEGVGPEPLRRAAAEGDARAQFEVAAIYTEGRAVPGDLAAAAIWYERAAAQGFAPAQYRLGSLYENGRGVEKDLQQARLWYQRAAEAGNRMAMHNLAALYAGGDLGKQQFDSAAQWFEQAATRGMRDSQFNLGMLYARGLGVPQDLEVSYKWFALAALRGDADAQKAREDIARSLDAESVMRLEAEVAAFVPAEIDLAANFAPIGTWSEGFDPGESISALDVVKSVQAALTALGYDVGTPDGIAGPKTAEAIRAFERATGMSESGAVNPRLLAVLGSQPV